MRFRALQKKAKYKDGEEKDEKGRFKRRKRFGKSLGNRAPAMFLQILERKLGCLGAALVRIDTRAARASQFNHAEQAYEKKTLSQRWNIVNGERVQRDMYSAFLIRNINPDLKTFSLEKCNARYPAFKEQHDAMVERLTGNKNLSSIAI